MSFEAFVFLSFCIGMVMAAVIIGANNTVQRYRRQKRRERNRIGRLEALCEKQKNQLIYYRNEAEING